MYDEATVVASYCTNRLPLVGAASRTPHFIVYTPFAYLIALSY